MTPLYGFIQGFREAATAEQLWHEIDGMRRYAGNPCQELPPSLSELQRSLRLLRMAGKLVEEWPPGATAGLWSVVAEKRSEQGALFT